MELGQTVKVKLISNQQIKGTIQSIASDSLTITDRETGQKRTILFSELAEIGKDKMRGWVKGLIIAGVAVGAALAILGAYYAKISSN
jgi:hypothetical protein